MIFRILLYVAIVVCLASTIAGVVGVTGSYSLEGILVRWHEKNLARGLSIEPYSGYQHQSLVLIRIIRGILVYVAVTSGIVFSILIASLIKISVLSR